MNCFIIFLLVAAVLIVTSGPAIRAEMRSRHRRRAYRRVTERFHGAYRSGGLIRKPAIVFRHGRSGVVVREGSLRGPYTGTGTQLTIQWPDRQLAWESFPRRDVDAARSARRFAEVTSGEPQFDARIMVRGQRATDVQRVLSDGVRWQLNRLVALDDFHHGYALLWRGQLLVQKPRLLRTFEELERFVEIGLDLFDQMMLTQAEGIDFVETATIKTLDGVVCKVCGEEIRDDLVYCRRCKTPHHGECWQYAGACSVFGCQEKVYLEPQRGGRREE